MANCSPMKFFQYFVIISLCILCSITYIFDNMFTSLTQLFIEVQHNRYHNIAIQNVFNDFVDHFIELNYSKGINNVAVSQLLARSNFHSLDIDFIITTYSDKTIVFFGDSLLRFQFMYFISILFYCTDQYKLYVSSASLPPKIHSCPEYCNRYKRPHVAIPFVFTACERDLFYEHNVPTVRFSSRYATHKDNITFAAVDGYHLYYIKEYNLTLLNIDKWASKLADRNTEQFKLSSFQYELIRLEQLHFSYDVLITNFVGMHFNHVKNVFEQPLSFYMHKYMEGAVRQFINDEYIINRKTKCVIVGTINSLCGNAFWGSDRVKIRDWMIIQSKMYLFNYFYDKITRENCTFGDGNQTLFDEWLMTKASSIHSNPDRIMDIPLLNSSLMMEFDSWEYYKKETNKFDQMYVKELFQLTDSQRARLNRCTDSLLNYKVYIGSSRAYRMNTCILYSRTPLSMNVIAHRIENSVMDMIHSNDRDTNLYYYDQHKLMRYYQHLCDDEWFIAVHFPPMYYIEFMMYSNMIYTGC
eukprot:379587_1